MSELKAATAQAECLKVEEPPPHVGSARKETVNGVTFTVIETDGVATGNLIDATSIAAFTRTSVTNWMSESPSPILHMLLRGR